MARRSLKQQRVFSESVFLRLCRARQVRQGDGCALWRNDGCDGGDDGRIHGISPSELLHRRNFRLRALVGVRMKSRDPDRQQAKRLLIAMAVLLGVVPVFGTLLSIFGLLILEYLWGGRDAVSLMINDWTRTSDFLGNATYRLMVGVVALLGFGFPIWGWHLVFFRSGYLSKETISRMERGDFPLVGFSWKILIQPVLIVGCALLSMLGFRDGNYSMALLYATGTGWLTFLTIKELRRWWRGRDRSMIDKAP